MNRLLRYLFTVQYDYRDPAEAARARVLVLLSTSLAGLSLAVGLYLVLASALQVESSGPWMDYGKFGALLVAIWALAALWHTKHGYVGPAAVLIALLLGSMALATLLIEGIAPGPILLLPLVLTYCGLIYGARGMGLIALASWIVLPLTAYLQAEGHLAAEAEPLGEVLYQALLSAGMLSLAALLLWMFSWHLQRALGRANRAAIQTRATAEIGPMLAQILDTDELLVRAVEVLQDRFAFYHVQIFLVDSAGDYANLAASTGPTGQALLAQGFRVAIDSRTVVGEVLSTRQVLNVPNLAATPYRSPALLTGIRSELAIPLLDGDRALGALDILSLRAGAFADEDLEAMRLMAVQLSQGIRNARLFEAQQHGLMQNRRMFLESETNLREIERLNRQLTGQSWQEYVLQQDASQFGVELVGDEVRSGPVEWTRAMRQAMTRQRMVSHEEGGEQVLAMPITIRGEAVGAIEVRLDGIRSQTEVRSILQAVTERMAFSLENARLFEQAHVAAEREQQINSISARLQGLNRVEDVLATAVSALGQALSAEQGRIQLAALSPEIDRTPPNGQHPSGEQGQDQSS
ncbi:MAG: GAF domain-containing protein [Chloroflexi bacterium]|nr:GAF domain-containing protein [Chloroflexota bacterium]